MFLFVSLHTHNSVAANQYSVKTGNNQRGGGENGRPFVLLLISATFLPLLTGEMIPTIIYIPVRQWFDDLDLFSLLPE